MIGASILACYGLLGLIAGTAALAKSDQSGHSRLPVRFSLSWLLFCHCVLFLMGVSLLLDHSYSSWLIAIICTVTVLSRIVNAHFYLGKIRWSHHLISFLLLGICLLFI